MSGRVLKIAMNFSANAERYANRFREVSISLRCSRVGGQPRIVSRGTYGASCGVSSHLFPTPRALLLCCEHNAIRSDGSAVYDVCVWRFGRLTTFRAHTLEVNGKNNGRKVYRERERE